MQTFLPYSSFLKSVQCLDNKRLGKQRVEAMQILNTLNGQSNGWRNHPATKMWEGYKPALELYHDLCIYEWRRRGFNNNMELRATNMQPLMPPFIGRKAFHDSHKSNLLRKQPEHYTQFNWNVPDNLPYIWPTNQGGDG